MTAGIHRTITLLIPLVLAACGGESGSGKPSSPGFAGTAPDPQAAYEGNSQAARLDGRNIAVFANLLLGNFAEIPTMPSPQAQTLSRAVQARASVDVSGTYACAAGGTVSTIGTVSDAGEMRVSATFRQCSDDGVTTWNGPVLLSSANFEETRVSFIDTTIQSPKFNYRLNGTIDDREADDPRYSTTRLDITFTNVASGVQVQFRQFAIVATPDPTLGRWDAWTESLSGRIYHSAYGYVDVETVSTLAYQGLGESAPEWAEAGAVRLTGGAASSAILSFRQQYVPAPRRPPGTTVATVGVQADVNGDGSYELAATTTTDAFVAGALDDIGDNDADRIPNSWETLYGLNPASSADSAQDADGDGFSNEVEYRGLSRPNDGAELPLIGNYGFRFTGLLDALKIGAEQPLEFDIATPADEEPPYFLVVFEKNDNADWGYTGSCRIDSMNGNRLFCNRFIESEPPISVKPRGDGPVSVRASVDVIGINNNPSTTSTFASTAFPSIADLQIKPYEYNPRVAVVGDTTAYVVRMFNAGPDPIPSAELTITIPSTLDRARVLADLTSLAGPLSNCRDAASITCMTGPLAAGEQREIRVGLSGTQAGAESLAFSIQSVLPDSRQINDRWAEKIYVGQPIDAIQSQIDAATTGTVVNIPAGIYIGGLTTQSKAISIRGAGKDLTLIAVDSPNPGFGPRFELTDGSSLSGVTVALADVNVQGGAFTLAENRFTDGSGLRGVFDITSATIRNNEFAGQKVTATAWDIDYRSSAIRLGQPTDLVVEGNLFIGGDSGRDRYTAAISIEYSSLPPPTARARISQNTIAGYDRGIAAPDPPPGHDVEITNNIVVSSRVGIVTGSDLPRSRSLPLVSGNLLHNNETSIVGEVRDTAGPNITADPRFIDRAAANLRLQANSPAIDSGVGNAVLSVDLDGKQRPIDGNADGLSTLDVGAYEYIP